MFKRICSIFFLALVLTIGVSLGHQAFAKNDNQDNQPELPEKEGTYDVPGHPNMKLRVFVYRVKEKERGRPAPSPTPTPTPVCGLLDPDSNLIDDPAGWHLPTTWSYNLNPGSAPASVSGANLPTISDNAFAVWESAITHQVELSKDHDTLATRAKLDNQHLIAWGRTSSLALAVTYIWYYPSTGEVADLDTIMNKAVVWSWSDPTTWANLTCAYPNSYDAQNILTHELGHWFGLDDMYTGEFEDNTMYGYGLMKETKKDTLTQGDILAVKSVY